MKVKLNIYRYDAVINAKPGYQLFEVDLDPRETVSGALLHIYENFDSSLAFRFTCNIQKCGECAVNVNNKPCLACEKTIEPEMIIDPLPNFPVIKDLVIDRYKVIRDLLEKCKSLDKLSLLWRRQSTTSMASSTRLYANPPNYIPLSLSARWAFYGFTKNCKVWKRPLRALINLETYPADVTGVVHV